MSEQRFDAWLDQFLDLFNVEKVMLPGWQQPIAFNNQFSADAQDRGAGSSFAIVRKTSTT